MPKFWYCMIGYDTNTTRSLQSTPQGSSICAKTNGAIIRPTKSDICAAYSIIKASFDNLIPADRFGRSALYGKAVRLAFHDAGEVDMSNTADRLGMLRNDNIMIFLIDMMYL